MNEIKVTTGIKNTLDAKNIRIEVFVEEQGFVSEFDEIDDTATFVVIYDNGYAIATGRIYPIGSGVFRMGRIAVRKSYRGSGVGRQLIDALESVALNLNAKEIVISSQLKAQGFYEKNGYIAYGDIYDEDGVDHIAMKKVM